jgi:hypothetical protein
MAQRSAQTPPETPLPSFLERSGLSLPVPITARLDLLVEHVEQPNRTRVSGDRLT